MDEPAEGDITMKKAYEAPALVKREALNQITAVAGCNVSMGKCGGPPPPTDPA